MIWQSLKSDAGFEQSRSLSIELKPCPLSSVDHNRRDGMLSFHSPLSPGVMEQKLGSKIAYGIYSQTPSRQLLTHSRTVSIIWGQCTSNMSLSGLQFSTADLAYQTAHIHEDKRPLTVTALAILSVLSTMAVILKLGIRWRMRAGFKEDDYTIILALVYISIYSYTTIPFVKLKAVPRLDIFYYMSLW